VQVARPRSVKAEREGQPGTQDKFCIVLYCLQYCKGLGCRCWRRKARYSGYVLYCTVLFTIL
jgi:hypothetical protein